MEGLLAWMLVAARVWALLSVQVLWRTAIGPIWWVIAGGLGLLLAPALSDGVLVGEMGRPWWLLLAFELLLGAVLGLVVSLPGYMLVGAGVTADTVVGLQPLRSRSLGFLVVVLTLTIGLTVGLHRPLLAGLGATMQWLPPGRPEVWLQWADSDGLGRLSVAVHAAVVLGLSLATPVLLGMAVIELVTTVLGRGPLPAAAVVATLRPWMRAAVALVALGAAWAVYPQAWMRAWG